MKYRRFGKLDFEASALGFGCMRLPTKGADSDVDVPRTVEMIRYAIDKGVNYVDTAHVYHGGNSEPAVAAALKDGYREKVKIADKLPVWEAKKADDFDRLFETELERLEVPRIDFYLLHCLNAPIWAGARDLGVLDWLEKIKADGKVGEVGFSFHDDYDLFVEIIEAWDGWSFCQMQYNYVNETVQAGTKGLEYAAGKGLGVVIMEPLLGGCLAKPPEEVRAILDSGPSRAAGGPGSYLPRSRSSGDRTPADWGLQWVWNKPEVSVVLSGMSAMEQVEENVESACASGVGSLTDEELDVIRRARQKYEELDQVGCTRCGYCMPCPSGVHIPVVMQLYNDMLVFKGNQESLNRTLYSLMPEGERASACTECSECEEKCPQDVKVSEWMPKVHETLAPQK